MLRSTEMAPYKRQSFGKCIFCGNTKDLTDEHIVPEFLTGVGEMIIENGSCLACNNYANETYEQPASQRDFLAVRHMLELKRKRRGKKAKPRRMPRVSYTAKIDEIAPEKFDEELPSQNYPPIYNFLVHEPPGLLAGIDRAAGATSIRVGVLHLGLPNRIIPASVMTQEPGVFGQPEMVIAKMAYCWAVAEKGLDAFDTTALLDLLCGRRSDVLNFVGGTIVPEQLAMLRLHKFYFRERCEFTTVLVHLFASFGGPIHEVVIGKAVQLPA
jgi:HNH endonuclease